MHYVITGGAGFIGSNAAARFLSQGHDVTLFDNMSRSGAEANLAWLGAHYGDRVRLVRGDVRDVAALQSTFAGADAVLHLAGQVAVTTSVADPRTDFEINALGTFNVLEAVRTQCPQAAFLNASTNKVYGGLDDVLVVEQPTRYTYVDQPDGIDEAQRLDFHSPYGCSKGAGDQYTIDYARIYGLRTVTIRQSCIYGPRQFGVEDQGWVAHFIIAAVGGRPLTIFGNGKQVRDLLHVDDLIDLYSTAVARIDDVSGQALNIGGGPDNTLSIWAEFGPLLAEIHGRPIPVSYADWRPGDQPVYISDIGRAATMLGWQPRIGVRDGIRRLYDWVRENRDLF